MLQKKKKFEQKIFVFQYVWAKGWGGVVGGWVILEGWKGGYPRFVLPKTILDSTSIWVQKKFLVPNIMLAKGGSVCWRVGGGGYKWKVLEVNLRQKFLDGRGSLSFSCFRGNQVLNLIVPDGWRGGQTCK